MLDSVSISDIQGDIFTAISKILSFFIEKEIKNPFIRSSWESDVNLISKRDPMELIVVRNVSSWPSDYKR